MTEPAGDPVRQPGLPSRGGGSVSGRTARPEPSVDLGRRGFFRAFAGELIQTAATVAGVAQALQRASAEAASAILAPAVAVGRPDAADGLVSGGGSGARGFRTAFREEAGVLLLVDQRRLPDVLVEYPCRSASEVALAIREMVIGGAPAIGQVAAIGMALTAERTRSSKPYARRATLRGAANALTNARPTAINLRWAIERMMARYLEVGDLSEDGDAIAQAMRAEADAMTFEAATDHGRLAEFGLKILPMPEGRPARILTHGQSGPLAGGQFGTALGVLQVAHHAERPLHVWVDESRPHLDGARLTAWELGQAGIPHTLVADSAAGHLMAGGEVDVVLVGADRVATNGDTASTIGTYAVAVLAARHHVPFYVCSPTSSIDLEADSGSAIPIEERQAVEVLEIRGLRLAPVETEARNPTVDITPADLISAIVTEQGIIRAPFEPGLRDALASARARRAASPPFGHIPAAEGA